MPLMSLSEAVSLVAAYRLTKLQLNDLLFRLKKWHCGRIIWYHGLRPYAYVPGQFVPEWGTTSVVCVQCLEG
jgi:hypothetical protein